MLGVLASSRGEPDDAREHLRTSIELAGDATRPECARRCDEQPRARRAGCRATSTAALALTAEALGPLLLAGDRHREAALHNNLADLLHAADREHEAMEHLKQAVAIFAEIGGDAGRSPPEIWKLVEW